MKKAYIAALCGIDGAGKSSVHAALRADPRFAATRFVAKQHRDNVEMLRYGEPDQWAAARLLAGSFAEAVRWAHGFDFLRFYDDEVVPYLDQPVLLISDRWTLCSAAYAYCGTSAGPDIEALLARCVHADLLIYLDLEPAEAVRRVSARPGGPNADETELILAEYQRAYEALLPSVGSDVIRIRNDDLARTTELAANHVLQALPDYLRH